VAKFKEFIRDCVKESFDAKTRIKRSGEVVFLTKEKETQDFRQIRLDQTGFESKDASLILN
jgi:hypothetical protein